MNQGSPEKDERRIVRQVRVEISWKSIFRVLLAGLAAYTAILLWPVFKLLVLAILIAVALYPIVRWVRRKGWPEWLGLLLASGTLLVVVVGCFAIIAPLVFRQVTILSENLPKVREQIIAQLPPSGVVHDALQQGLSSGTVADSKLVLERTLMVVRTALGGLFNFVIVIALAVYLLVDGPRAVRWLIVFFPVAEHERISQALKQMFELVFSYVAGQSLISAFAATYLFAVLTVLGVPMALLLGIVAGICDILPIIGFFIAVFLAMAMALTVSPATAALVFVLYGAYHLFENFFIVPRVYGRKLKLSKLTVPLAVAAGGLVAGVVGAIAVLPIVAAYPVIERLWLGSKLGPDAVKAHEGRTV